MSGYAGIFSLNRSDINTDRLTSMVSSISYRGPDKINSLCHKYLGLGHALLCTTPESLNEIQPLVINGLYFAGDVRLDNREELIDKFDSSDRHTISNLPDPDIILLAYNKWDIKCLNYLVGDFAFLLYDKHKDIFYCVRDQLGIKQLYYAIYQDTLLVSSDISAVITAMDSPPIMDEALVTSFLAGNEDFWRYKTIYKDIYRLEAGHLLEIRKNTQIRQYFEFNVETYNNQISRNEYLENFREVFSTVIRAKSRHTGKIGFEVSGGLDSSSVICMAHSENLKDKLFTDTPHIYSHQSRLDKLCDDLEHFEHVIKYCKGWQATIINADETWALKENPFLSGIQQKEPDISLSICGQQEILESIYHDKTRVLLDGQGGDQVFLSDAYLYPLLLFHLNTENKLHEWKYFKNTFGLTNSYLVMNGLLKPTVKQLLPGIAVELIRDIKNRQSKNYPEWLNNIKDIYPVTKKHGKFIKNANFQDLIINYLTGGFWQKVISEIDHRDAYAHVEKRHPYLDIRLVKFILSSERSMIFSKGLTKNYIREGLVNVVPAEIRNRRTFCTNQYWIEKGWKQMEKKRIINMLHNSVLIEHGLVNKYKLEKAWNNFWNGDNNQLWQLSAWLNIEIWLQKSKINH